jgi:hypothetical protein
MRVRSLFVVLLGCGIATFVCHGAARAQDNPTTMQVGLGYDFSSGKYGGSERTTIHYVPVTTKLEHGSWTLHAAFPYLRIDGGEGVIEGPDGPVLVGEGVTDGIGDIVFRAAYTVYPWTAWMPWIDLIGRIKLPSADEDDGLGTGEFDYTVETELTQTFAAFTPFASVGYRFQGDPSGVDLRNVWLASVGAMYEITEAWAAGLFLDYRESTTAFSDEQLELVPFVGVEIGDHWKASLYAVAGLTDGSADGGFGLHVSYALNLTPDVVEE